MPGKRQKKNGGHYERKNDKDSQKAVICYCPQVCPDVMQVQLHYNLGKAAQGLGAVSIVDFVIRGNSPFDPDFAVGGQQAMGFDQWSAFYRRYRVLGSKIDLSATNDSAVNAAFGVVPLNTSSALISATQLLETQYNKQKYVGGDASKGVDRLTSYISTAKMRGGPHDIVHYESDLTSVVTGNPTEQWYWHMYAYGIGAGATNFDCTLIATITYYVQFYDRETLVRS